MFKIQIVLFDGFDLLDALAPYEVFTAASTYADHALSVELVTAEGPRFVTSGVNGLKIEANAKLDLQFTGIILVPGVAGEVHGDGPDSIPAILSRVMNTELTGLMQQAFEQKDITIATVCGGSLLLAMGGLLEGRPAVTHHMGMDVLGATGVIPVPARVVDDGNLVSGGGVTSGLDVALYLVEREFGSRIAHAIEQLFEYERRGTVWKETGMKPLRKNVEQNSSTDNSPTNQEIITDQTLPTSSSFDGEWDTIISTPVGKLQVKLLIGTTNGSIQGKAMQGDEIVEFIDPVLKENKLSWLLRITKPMRLNLKFEVMVNGKHMTGTAKAGILPASTLTGNRVS